MIFQVTLPNLPLPAPHNTFQPQLWRSSSEEAKSDAAGMVLSLLRMSPDYLATAAIVRSGPGLEPAHGASPHLAPAAAPPLYSHALGPTHLQGVPLYTPGPGFTLSPGSSLYSRLPYADPYTSAAYASMLHSMYGLSIAV